MIEFGITGEWNSYLDRFIPERMDVFFLEDYWRVFSRLPQDDAVEAFYYAEGNFVFVFPYILRKIADTDFYDFETVYGYSGPFWNIDDRDLVKRAVEKMKEALFKKKVIAGFVRFNPFTDNNIAFDFLEVVKDRDVVVVDLTLDEEELINKAIHQKHRNAINKSMRSNVEFFEDVQFNFFPDFLQLYRQTMERLSATDFYFFNEDFFYSLRDNLAQKLQMFCIRLDQKIISSCLTLKHGNRVHLFLSASADEALRLSSNTLLIYKTSLALKGQGGRSFNLGGGRSSNDDSLFQFKSRFSKKHLPFYIGKFMINENAYHELTQSWEKNKSSEALDKYGKLFLRYRY